MRHKKGYLKLNRKTSHRMAVLDNMVVSMIQYGGITTTLQKAKALRPYFERFLTKVKNNIDVLDVKRSVFTTVKKSDLVSKLYNELIPSIVDRNGGYTRITKLYNRVGDGSTVAKIELV